jgi:hypothetical protein
MAKYQTQVRDRAQQERAKQLHPIWRGVGFALAILIPIISYAATEVLLDANRSSNWFRLPSDIVARPGDFLYNGDPWLYLKVACTLAFMFLFYTLFMLITFAVNRATLDPRRTDPFYVPPIKGRVKKHSR